MELHAAGEDYLETVLLLEQEKQMVYSVDLAKRMGVTRASVSRAVGILCDGGFLCVEGRVLRLTEKGRNMAQQVHEKQMFFERWLMAGRGCPRLQRGRTPAASSMPSAKRAMCGCAPRAKRKGKANAE